MEHEQQKKNDFYTKLSCRILMHFNYIPKQYNKINKYIHNNIVN